MSGMSAELRQVVDFAGMVSPLLIAAQGALLSEYVGMLNIGMEGFMLIGAFSAVAFLKLGFGILAALLCTAGIVLVFGLILVLANQSLGANIFIAGLAINLLAAGFVSFGGSALFGTRSVVRLDSGPPVQSSELAFALFAILLTLALWVFLRSTRNGFRVRVLGAHPEMLTARGIDVSSMARVALLFSALCGGIAGAALSIQLGSFVPNQSAGKGWIALVLVFVGGRNPIGIVLASLAFVFLDSTSGGLQAGVDHPAALVGLPYLLVLVGFVISQALARFSRRRRSESGTPGRV